MIEVLYDAIKAIAGQEINISVVIEDADVDNATLVIYNPEGEVIAQALGAFVEEFGTWGFTIPADATKGLSGKYSYCIQSDGKNLCFKQPLYLMG